MGFLDPKVTPGNIDFLTARQVSAPGSATNAALSATTLAAMASRAPNVYDIREFGSIKNEDGSVADIRPALEAFRTAMAGVTKPRRVFIPDGTYKLTRGGVNPGHANDPYSLWWKDLPLGVLGESKLGTVIQSATDATPFYAAYGSALKDIEFSNFTLDCTPQLTGNAFSNATFTASNDQITTGTHGLAVGDHVFFRGLSANSGLLPDTDYVVKSVVSSTKFTVSLTAGGATVDILSDGTATAVNKPVYTTQYKGLFMQDIERLHVHDMVFKGSWGTSIGCDALVDYNFHDLTFYEPGRGIRMAAVADPATASGASAIGIGTGKYQYEPGLINNVIVRNAGRNAIFYERQTAYTYFSRGHVAKNVTAIGCWSGLQDCGADGLVADLSATDGTYGVYLDGTSLEPKAGINGRVTVQAERNSKAGVYFGNIPDGSYEVNGVARGTTAGPGVWAGPASTIGPRVSWNGTADNNAGSGVLIQAPQSVKALRIRGTARGNGTDAGQTYRDGVTITSPTDLLDIDVVALDDKASPTQQNGIRLVGAGVTAARPRLVGDVRANVANALLNEQVVSNAVYRLDGANPDIVSGLAASRPASGTLALSWTAPIDASGVTDYQVQYATSSGGPWTTVSRAASTTTTQSITGLTDGTPYYVRVAAVRSGAVGAYTSPLVATPTAPLVYTDTFNRADGAPLGTFSDSSGTWNAVQDAGTGATWGISANAAKPLSGTGNSIVTRTVPFARYRVRGTVKSVGGAYVLGLVARSTGPNDLVMASLRFGSAAGQQVYCIQRKLAGVTAQLFTSAVVPTNNDVVEIEVADTLYFLYVNGTLLNPGGTAYGNLVGNKVPGMFGNFAVDATAAWDDFRITEALS
ncbi:fibronectin type III domain-containing protein [Pseudarthrobacter enclensis]|uniref:fibronectin type III domain-containing protein n=1 Tax=Pseudarthrobacter enclensis TaxID=993070 RepID=UPI0036CFD625